MKWLMKIIGKYFEYFDKRFEAGLFVLAGGRRSGKTTAIMQFLTLACLRCKLIVNVAAMTSEQARLGAYRDASDIVADPAIANRCMVMKSPRELRFHNGSVMFFNSYMNSSTAKGIKCDYLYINEADNFTEQQYLDLSANVRYGIFIDFNPHNKFWVNRLLDEDEMLFSSWRDNPYLTKLQLEYFETLKRNAFRDNATAYDRYIYEVYYEGKFAELNGDIFTPYVFTFGSYSLSDVCYVYATSDPSALRGGDFFAMCLFGVLKSGGICLLDSFSINEGTREELFQVLDRWCRDYELDPSDIFVETFGIIGADFFEELRGREHYEAARSLNLSANKFERVIANYERITKIAINDTMANRHYMEQVYTFGQKCEHDDNVDCLEKGVEVYRRVIVNNL